MIRRNEVVIRGDMITEDHMSDHLFLLVGGNPLPNYVAARLLRKEKGYVSLVYTEGEKGTEKYARSLSKLLKIPWGCCVGIIDESDAFQVHKRIKPIVPLDRTISVGLHYTGGTKVMAIHAYETIKRLRPDAICSYLDPRQLALRVEILDNNAEPKTYKLNTSAMRAAIKTPFITLLELYSISLHPTDRPRHRPVLANVGRIILASFNSDNDQDIKARRKPWYDWKKRFKATHSFEDCPYAEVRGALAALHINTAHDLMLFYNTSIRDEYDEWTITNAIDWIEKTVWFEDIVLDAVTSIKEEVDFSEVLLGVQTDPIGKYFEIDVVAMRGYQAYVFSCTTDYHDGPCKEKLFEVALRATQLGGDEARFALVCCHRNKQKIKKEIGDLLTPDKFEVFDRQDLGDLSRRVRAWVERVDREVTV